MRRVVGERTQQPGEERLWTRSDVQVPRTHGTHARDGARVCGVRSGTDNRSKRETKSEKKVVSGNMILDRTHCHTCCHSLARTVTRCGPSSLPSASSVAALAARKASSPFSRLKGVSSGSPASCSVTLDA